MAFDGLVIAALTDEFSRALTGGRIQKIYQPEADELMITIKMNAPTTGCCFPQAPLCRWLILQKTQRQILPLPRIFVCFSEST